MTNRAVAKVRGGGIVEEFERRVLAGDVRAMRALVRQAAGPNTISMRFTEGTELRSAPNGTGGDKLLFTGCASVVEVPFTITDWLGDFTEIIRAGAFTRTLANEPDVIFTFNHLWDGPPMARTAPAHSGSLRLSTDDAGSLMVEADLDGSRADVHQLRSAHDAGDVDAMSFAFWVTQQTWSPDYDQRDILEVDIDGGDVSEVTWPGNPATTGTTDLRTRQARALLRSRVPALISERARAEQLAGKALSASTMETLQEVLDLIAAADESVDAAQPLLAALMGVPNPDADPNDDNSSGTESEAKNAHQGMSLVRLQLLEDPALRPA
jgi:HK97 family phage prohead protease